MSEANSSQDFKNLRRVFVANRGEILRRIAYAAKDMGLEVVAIQEGEQPKNYLCGLIDFFEKAPSKGIYMQGELLIELAKKTDCDCLHPGFGFLSEDAKFAQQCQDAGIVFIGPSVFSISKMGEKSKSRAIAEKAGLLLAKGLSQVNLEGKEEDEIKRVVDWAKDVQFPLLIKASSGGGGRGMVLVHEPSQLKEGLLRCHSESKKAYQNSDLVVEQYIGLARHIEVQILGDKHGNIIALGERDCSIQRRHQKIIEEAPAPYLSLKTREKLKSYGLALARQVQYYSAGTVEFLVDWSDPKAHECDVPIYFLEMNTRLQVEHPVTEQAFGIDLVQWQFRIAMGEKIPADFANKTPLCAAIEARVYAEDPANNFFPAPGIVDGFYPAIRPGVRYEIGIDAQDEITSDYDPMIAKVISCDENRERALSKLLDALENTFLAGILSNKEYLQQILQVPVFQKYCADSHFIRKHHDIILNSIGKAKEDHRNLFDKAKKQFLRYIDEIDFGTASSLQQNIERIFAAKQELAKTSLNFTKCSLLRIQSKDKKQIFCTMAEIYNKHKQVLALFTKSKEKQKIDILCGGQQFTETTDFFLNYENTIVENTKASMEEVVARVPGKVIKIVKSAMEAAQKSDTILVLESMKMEYEVKADGDGIIKQIHVKIGEQVQTGQKLFSFTQEQN